MAKETDQTERKVLQDTVDDLKLKFTRTLELVTEKLTEAEESKVETETHLQEQVSWTHPSEKKKSVKPPFDSIMLINSFPPSSAVKWRKRRNLQQLKRL